MLGSFQRSTPFCLVLYFLFSFGGLVDFEMGRVERYRHQKHEVLRPKNSRQHGFRKTPLVKKTADDFSPSQD